LGKRFIFHLLNLEIMKTFFLNLLLIISIVLPGYLFAQLSGGYTINSTLPTGGGNFNSFNDFANALSVEGVSGNVTATVNLGTGPYDEQVVFENITGLGPDASITIEGNGETITAVTSTTDRYVIRLSNMEHFTINNLHIAWNPESTGGFYGIHIFETGNHITISNCSVDLTGTSSTLYGAYIASGGNTSILTTGDFHDINIINNTSSGGGYGASVFGLVSNLASNILIDGNAFNNFHSNGVYLRETNGAVVNNNYFDKSTENVTSCNAIQVAQNANINAEIFNNRISMSQTANGTMTFRGIYLFNGTGHKVYNNVIHDINLTSGNVIGIEVRTGGTSPEIYFNTISIDNELATTGNLYGIKEELSNTNSVLRNNMINISQTSTGNRSGLVLGATSVVTTAFNSNYNNIYVPGGNVGQRGTLTPTFYPSLMNWQTASSQDANSLAVDPEFQGSEPIPTNDLINDAGVTIPEIEVDILGVTRGTPPDIGAYEMGGCPLPVAGPIQGSSEVCAGSLGVLYSVPSNDDFLDYIWSITAGASIVAGQGTSQITVDLVDESVELSVVVLDSCGQSTPAVFQIVVNALPVVTFNLSFDSWCIEGGELVLSGESPQGGEFFGPGVSDGSFDPQIAGLGSHEITYSYSDSNGCVNEASATISVDICNSISDLQGNDIMQVFPNPAINDVQIEIGDYKPGSVLRVMDAIGREVMQVAVNSNRIQLTQLPEQGTYLLVLVSDSEIKAVSKLVVQ
jgi:hypothetical protein